MQGWMGWCLDMARFEGKRGSEKGGWLRRIEVEVTNEERKEEDNATNNKGNQRKEEERGQRWWWGTTSATHTNYTITIIPIRQSRKVRKGNHNNNDKRKVLVLHQIQIVWYKKRKRWTTRDRGVASLQLRKMRLMVRPPSMVSPLFSCSTF